jgi:hypothetical protein
VPAQINAGAVAAAAGPIFPNIRTTVPNWFSLAIFKYRSTIEMAAPSSIMAAPFSIAIRAMLVSIVSSE